jgi:nucleoside-diphosphate-sugar epimerase
MSYLITGGTGLIGAHTVRLLIDQEEQVVAYNRSPDRKLLENLMGKEKSSRVKVVQGDVTDLAQLLRTCQEHGVEKILHMGAVLTEACSANPPLGVRVNCDGTINVFETARILGLKRVVFASSVAVYGPAEKYGDGCVSNDAPHSHRSIYAACKSFNEACANHYFAEYGVDCIGIRFPGVYGEGQSRGLPNEITEQLFVNPVLGKPGKIPLGESRINWLYAGDAARAVVMAAGAATTKTRNFTINGNDERSLAEVAGYVKRMIPEADITLLPGRRLSYGLNKLDTTPAREEFGFQPEWTMEKGVTRCIQFLQRIYQKNISG